MSNVASDDTAGRQIAPQAASVLALTLCSSFVTLVSVVLWVGILNILLKVLSPASLGPVAMAVLITGFYLFVLLAISSAIAAAPLALLACCPWPARMGLGAANLTVASVTLAGFTPVFRDGAGVVVASGIIGYLLTWLIAGQALGVAAMAGIGHWAVMPIGRNSVSRPLTIRGLMLGTAALAALFASPGPAATVLQTLQMLGGGGNVVDPTSSIRALAPSMLYALAIIGLATSPAAAASLWCMRSRLGWFILFGYAGLLAAVLVTVALSVDVLPPWTKVAALLLAVDVFCASLMPAVQARLWQALGWYLVRQRAGGGADD